MQFVGSDAELDIVSHVLAKVVGDLYDFFPRVFGAHAAAAELHHDIGCLVAGDAGVAGEVGAYAGADLDASAEICGDFAVLGESEGVAEYQQFGAGVDAEFFQAGDYHVADYLLVAGILTEAVEQLCLLEGEGMKEGCGCERVYEGRSKGAVVDPTTKSTFSKPYS